MSFCFCNGSETHRYQVLLGVVLKGCERPLVSRDWKSFLNDCSGSTRRLLTSYHQQQRSEHDIWIAHYRDGADSPIHLVMDWFQESGLTVVFSAVERARFRWHKRRWEVPRQIDSEWTSMAFHLALAVQKAFAAAEEDRGSTQFLFDERLRVPIEHFESLVADNPRWSDAFHGHAGERRGLSHVVAAPLFATTDGTELLHLPYLLASVVRRYIEMQENETLGTSIEEVNKVDRWFKAISQQCIEYPYQEDVNHGPVGLFRALTPKSLRRSGPNWVSEEDAREWAAIPAAIQDPISENRMTMGDLRIGRHS